MIKRGVHTTCAPRLLYANRCRMQRSTLLPIRSTGQPSQAEAMVAVVAAPIYDSGSQSLSLWGLPSEAPLQLPA